MMPPWLSENKPRPAPRDAVGNVNANLRSEVLVILYLISCEGRWFKKLLCICPLVGRTFRLRRCPICLICSCSGQPDLRCVQKIHEFRHFCQTASCKQNWFMNQSPDHLQTRFELIRWPAHHAHHVHQNLLYPPRAHPLEHINTSSEISGPSSSVRQT